MAMGWPFGTLRNVYRRVSAIGHNIYLMRNTYLPIINLLCFDSITGPVFGNMDNFTGLGVFVDTYPNEEKQLEVCRSGTA